MARTKGTANLSGTIEPLAGGALDARSVVQTKADLTAINSFPYSYIGMETYVVAENKKYRLIGSDPTVLSNWEKEGGSADVTVYTPGGSLTFENLPVLSKSVLGYVYNVTNDFVTTSDFVEGAGKHCPAGTNVAVVATGTASNPVYKFDASMVMIDLDDYQKKFQFATMPTASEDLEGVIFQYIGTTTASYTTGYFYKCVEESGSYSWTQTDVQPSSGGASESEIAPVEATSTASKAYAVGDLLIYDGKLYRVTAAIASGGTIIPTGANANCVETSVSEVFVRKTGDTMMGKLILPHATIGSRGGRVSPDNFTSLAVGNGVDVSAHNAVAIGYGSHALKQNSLALGGNSQTNGMNSLASGYRITTVVENQVAIGKCNKFNADDAFEIGNGTDDDNRSNALEVTWNGDLTVAGDITDGQGNSLKGVNGNLATIETTTTASQAYGVGDYLVYGGQLYKVTTAIASGGTIVPTGSGANVAETTVSENLGTGGGSGDAETTEDITSNIEVGGIPSGTLIPTGTTITEFVKRLLVKETAPTITVNSSESSVIEVGKSFGPTLTLNITGTGTGTPTSIKFYNGNTLTDTQAYVEGTNTYTYNYISTTIVKAMTITLKAVLEYTKSDGTSGTVEKSITHTFVYASYSGVVTTAPTTISEIRALTKNVKNGKGFTTTFNLSNQRACYCYPASMGNLTSIKDANNFEYISSYTKTTVSVDGTNYNVYTLTDPVTASGFKQVYA